MLTASILYLGAERYHHNHQIFRAAIVAAVLSIFHVVTFVIVVLPIGKTTITNRIRLIVFFVAQKGRKNARKRLRGFRWGALSTLSRKIAHSGSHAGWFV